MAGITQVIDERIVEMRKERAELDALRARLEKKDEELRVQEERLTHDVNTLEDKKKILQKEIKEYERKLDSLRIERIQSVEGFGEEMESLYAEKTSQVLANENRARKEIAKLTNEKKELEKNVQNLRSELEELEDYAEGIKNRLRKEQEDGKFSIERQNEEQLRELSLAHATAIHAMEEEKKKLESEIADLEKVKTAKLNELDAELARHRESLQAQFKIQENESLTIIEAEREQSLLAISEEKRKLSQEISEKRQELEKEIFAAGVEKQKILDEIKLLEYRFEKQKSENQLHLEKTRTDELKAIEAKKAEELAELEASKLAFTSAFKKESAEEKTKHLDVLTKIEDETRKLENKKLSLIRETDELKTKFEHQKSELIAKLELVRGTKLKEIDEERYKKLREVENVRQIRIAEIEDAFMKKTAELDKKRQERYDAIIKAISEAELVLETTIKKRKNHELELNQARLEVMKINEENAAMQKTAAIEKRLELEKMAREKLDEVEQICAERITRADTLIGQLDARRQAIEDDLHSNTERLHEVKRELSMLEDKLTIDKETKLAQIQEETITMSDRLSKLKISKLAEIDESLEKYKSERMAQIQADFNNQVKLNYKTMEELALLNQDYQRRLGELRENEIRVESEKNNYEFISKRHKEEVTELKRLLQKETDLNRKEHGLIAEAKDKQIQFLQDQLANFLSAEAGTPLITP